MISKNSKKAVIKKSCHAELVSVSRFFGKKAAMFGLDARIALAIFGALSIITGAALYSALNQVKYITFTTDLNEITKAFENYWLDTSSLPPRYNSDKSSENFHQFKGGCLVEDCGVVGWKGPYLDYEKGEGVVLKYSKIDKNGFFYYLSLDETKDFGGSKTFNYGYCLSGAVCSLWIAFAISDESYFTYLDEKIDNGDGYNVGDVRMYTDSVDGLHRMYFKMIFIPNGID